MSTNSFIVTANGFIKECKVVFDKKTSTKRKIIEYTDKLMFAKQFSRKNANKSIIKYGLDGFVYKPKEIVYRDLHRRWEVVRESSWDVSKNKVQMYYAREVFQDGFSDVDFIRNGKIEDTKYLTEEEARTLANEKNQELLKNIKLRIRLLK